MWVQENEQRLILQVGKIGAIIVDFPEPLYKPSLGIRPNVDAYMYKIHWHENVDYISGEGLEIRGDYLPADTPLIDVRKRAVEWAKRLLDEARDGMPDEL